MLSKQAEIIEALIAKSGSLRAAARTLGYEPGYICELRKEHKPMSINFIQAVGTVYPDLIPVLGEYLWGSAYTNQGKGRHGAGSLLGQGCREAMPYQCLVGADEGDEAMFRAKRAGGNYICSSASRGDYCIEERGENVVLFNSKS
jgi:hypothetical protein